MKSFVLVACFVFLMVHLPQTHGEPSVTDLLKAFIQNEEGAKLLQEASVQETEVDTQSFSLNIIGCSGVSGGVHIRLANFLRAIFPGRRITLSCTGETSASSGGVTYTRWGHNACPDVPGTQMLYSGVLSGAFYNQKGGGANYLCLPSDPQYTLKSASGRPNHYYSRLYGTEYEGPIVGTNDHGVPCVVCYATTRGAEVMIPAKTSCPPNWTREYYGYIMSEANLGDRSRNQYICVDKAQVSLPGSRKNINGNVLYHVRATCHGIHCPPYNAGKALTCAVCTN